MTTSKHIELADQRAPAAWDAIKRDSKAVVARLRSMIVGGKKLNDNEVMALTAYSLANDLNPFNGESYFIPGSGPAPGIAGYRKKARQQVHMEAKTAKLRAPYFVENYRLITDPEEAGHDPDQGDIAYECTVTDNVSLQGHADVVTDAVVKLIKAGLSTAEAMEAAEQIAGGPPGWTGIGVVYGVENFGKQDKFSRHERARKRAAKLAIKKRFPSLDLPSSIMDGFGDDPIIAVEIPEEVQQIAGAVVEPEEKKTEAEILDDLGFPGEPPEAPEEPPIEGTYTADDLAIGKGTNFRIKKPTRPYNPEELKARLLEKAQEKGTKYASAEQRNLLAGLLSQNLQDDDKRHTVQKFLFGEPSSKKIPDTMVLAAIDWLHYAQDSGGAYTISPMARKELSRVYDQAIKEEGQQGLFK